MHLRLDSPPPQSTLTPPHTPHHEAPNCPFRTPAGHDSFGGCTPAHMPMPDDWYKELLEIIDKYSMSHRESKSYVNYDDPYEDDYASDLKYQTRGFGAASLFREMQPLPGEEANFYFERVMKAARKTVFDMGPEDRLQRSIGVNAIRFAVRDLKKGR